MLAACFLLAIVTASGCLLTFLYDRSAPFPARLAMGAASGMVLFAAVGFLFALWLGLGAASIALALLVMLLPLLLLARKDFRLPVVGQIRRALQSASQAARRPARRTIAQVLFYCGLTVMLAAVFASAAYETPDGIFTAVRNDLGDLPLHLQVINSFAQGHNLPPEDPTFAGVRFAYPFMVDFLAALLVGAGADVISAMWAENMFAAMALIGMLHYLTWLLTRGRLAGFIAPLLVLFSGGLGWVRIFQDVHDSEHGLLPLLGSLPHSYTIMDAGGLLRWGNSLTTLFVPQRSILFGMPLAIGIFCQWWLAVADDPGAETEQLSSTAATRRMLAAGIFAGLLPLVHAHTFLVVMGVGACLALIFHSRDMPRSARDFACRLPLSRLAGSLTPSSASSWRKWLNFLTGAIIVALPQLLWLGRSGGVKLSSYLGWQPGWDNAHFNPVLFWLANTGLFIPLLIVALAWRSPGFALPGRVLKFYAPFLLCFILPNLFKVAPWIWDNIKVLFWWYVASAPLVAWVMAHGFRQRKRGVRWLAAGALATLLLAGALDVLAVVTGAQEYREFNRDGMAMAKVISERVPPRAVVLHAPEFNSPVFLTGRRSLMGYAGWMWSRGLGSSQRQADIQRMYAGAPEAAALLRQYQVDYVLIGPSELASLNVNPQFWSQYSQVARIGPYQLYRTGVTH